MDLLRSEGVRHPLSSCTWPRCFAPLDSGGRFRGAQFSKGPVRQLPFIALRERTRQDPDSRRDQPLTDRRERTPGASLPQPLAAGSLPPWPPPAQPSATLPCPRPLTPPFSPLKRTRLPPLKASSTQSSKEISVVP